MFQVDIIEKCKQNNRKAQVQLYNQYCDGMYIVAKRFLKDAADAEDVVQEAFIKAFSKLHQYKAEVTFGAWLKRIVVNKSIDFLKSKKMHLVELDAVSLKVVDTPKDDKWLVEDTITLDDVKLAINELPEKYQYVVMLYLIEGYDHQEISEILDISEVASRTQLSRGKVKLQKLLTLKKMAQDIRELFKNDKITTERMPKNHQDRFVKKLDEALPEAKQSKFSWMHIAASVIVLLGLSFGAFKYFQPQVTGNIQEIVNTKTVDTKTLGDISPGLKKVEDYYLASINSELSKMTFTSGTKELFDGYLIQLNELDMEYQRLSLELTESGPSELTVNALIDNLKLRLNLLYRLRSQLQEFNTSDAHAEGVSQSI